MQRYDSYKPSGVKWLGEIPSHWEMRKMKFSFEERSQKGFPNLPLLAATQNHGVIRKTDYENRTVEATKSLDTLKLVEIGDFVISLRSFQGGIELCYEKGIISPAYTILRPTHITAGYFKHLGKSPIFIQLLKSMVTGIREGQNIDYGKLRENLLPIPPIAEQTAIANYLDTITAKIDAAIAQQQKMIDLLNERKQIIINRAVTRGLNPNARMKDSGVEWIGEVPEGWRPITLKRLFVSRVAGSWGEDENTNSMNSICLRIADFNYNTLSFKIKEDYTIRSYSSAEVEKKHLHGGDVLIEKSGGGEKTPVGRCVLYDLDLDKPMYANFMEKLSCRSFVNPKYIVYLMSSLYSAGVVWPYIKATTGIQNLDITSLLSREVVFIPSLREQKQIVELLKDRTRLLLNAIESCYNQISLLQERKQIIINDVVTGKVKVV